MPGTHDKRDLNRFLITMIVTDCCGGSHHWIWVRVNHWLGLRVIICNRLLLLVDTPSPIKWGNKRCCTYNGIIRSASCLTYDGPAEGSACAFPFSYMGVSHTGCSTIDGDARPWCVTQTDASGDMAASGAWGYCEASCPLQGLP